MKILLLLKREEIINSFHDKVFMIKTSNEKIVFKDLNQTYKSI